MLIKTVRGYTPSLGERCFIAENATLIGDLIMGNDCSVWYQAVVRGDVNAIRIGNQVNIQDGIDPNLQQNEIERITQNYLKYASWFK